MVLSKQIISSALSLVMVILVSACASKSFLKVHYQLPSPSQVLTGQNVVLTIADVRKDNAVLSANAKKSLKNFDDTYSLVVLHDDGRGNLIGAYDLNSLLREIFKQRLENEGGHVITNPENADASLEIHLKEFKLDIVKRKWMLRMSYRAGLSKNRDLVAKESVNGSAERLKVMGKSDAEKILGELVTDMVNKLDVARLFQQVQR